MTKIKMDLRTARKLMREAVRENPNKVAEPYYTSMKYEKIVPMCIVGTIFFKAGVPVDELAQLDGYADCSITDLYRRDEFPVELTPGAYSFLADAQTLQDNKVPWGALFEEIEKYKEK